MVHGGQHRFELSAKSVGGRSSQAFFSCTLPFIKGEGNTTTGTLKKAKNPATRKTTPLTYPTAPKPGCLHAGDDLDADIGRWHGVLVDLVRLLAALVDDHLVVLAAKHLLRL